MKPHKVEAWLHTRKDQPDYEQQVGKICELYRQAPALHVQRIHVVSVDEKTGIQALERLARTPMKAHQVARQDCEYIRHGTPCLIANLEIAPGKIRQPTVQNTRTEQDFVTHIHQTVASAPTEQWIFIVDQLNTHKSASLVEYIAEACGLDEERGVKGKCGVLQSMETRMNFWSDPPHRIRFVYTPKHASWLHQIECGFSHLLRRLSVSSKEKLRELILAYIEYHNRVSAKPFKWLYRGNGK
ncbi:conserved hypothetical protein [Xenorhabdus nematophila str. Anatoliense]|nr:conserved hypothetical protein [Xenorhabdus nematophila str. Anatoliense]CEE92855.1 conserved hypothetical protein [Xenorhabdus nematophila str. Anatoliense]